MFDSNSKSSFVEHRNQGSEEYIEEALGKNFTLTKHYSPKASDGSEGDIIDPEKSRRRTSSTVQNRSYLTTDTLNQKTMRFESIDEVFEKNKECDDIFNGQIVFSDFKICDDKTASHSAGVSHTTDIDTKYVFPTNIDSALNNSTLQEPKLRLRSTLEIQVTKEGNIIKFENSDITDILPNSVSTSLDQSVFSEMDTFIHDLNKADEQIILPTNTPPNTPHFKQTETINFP